jgi:imidazolonepropionase-like amidohydrolase
MHLERNFALVGGTLIDGRGGAPVPGTTVVVREGRLAAIRTRGSTSEAKRGSAGAGLQEIDASGLVLMPGLMDCHLHLTGLKSHDPVDWITEPNHLQAMRTVAEARRLLEHGFTTVRSAGSRFDVDLRQAIAEGTLIGPRIVAAGLGISRSRGHGDLRRDIYNLSDEYVQANHPFAQTCDGVEEVRRAVRRLIGRNVDLIKLWVSGGGFWARERCTDVHFSREEVRTIVEEAQMCGLPVMAHCENIRAIALAVELGVENIEHADNEDGEEMDDALCQAMADRGIFLTPTLSIYFVGPWAVQRLPENLIRGWKRARQHGVRLLAGSDAYADPVTPFGPYNAGELGLMAEHLGMSPLEVIRAATADAAVALRLEDRLGTLEEGKLADILVLKADPSEDISVLTDRSNLRWVIKEGRLVVEG